MMIINRSHHHHHHHHHHHRQVDSIALAIFLIKKYVVSQVQLRLPEPELGQCRRRRSMAADALLHAPVLQPSHGLCYRHRVQRTGTASRTARATVATYPDLPATL
eukprot:COSAG05_NODE_875_length_6828_cov_1.915886_4_plen_105_part_00